MGKHAKRSDGLGVRGSRVEKSRGLQRNDPRLPSWYHRVRAVLRKEDREVYEVYGRDFDEDLSELEEGTEQEDSDDPDEEDAESEISYDGSDAKHYYVLKAERQQRKRVKLVHRKAKERQREREKEKEEEVRAAYKSLKKAKKDGKKTPVGVLDGQSFTLFCGDHVDHFYSGDPHDLYGTKRVDFCHLDDTNDPHLHKQKAGSSKTDMLCGIVYLDWNSYCSFGPFQPPKRARRKVLKVRSDNGKYELSFQFLGNGYLKVSVPREVVFMDQYSDRPAAATAPETFKFVGIWPDWEKEKAERQKARRPSPPSPKENWFNMSHPMGSWAQSNWDF